MDRDYKLYDKVRIKKTGEIAFIVWYDDTKGHDSVMLEIDEANEMPEFYKRADFEIID